MNTIKKIEKNGVESLTQDELKESLLFTMNLLKTKYPKELKEKKIIPEKKVAKHISILLGTSTPSQFHIEAFRSIFKTINVYCEKIPIHPKFSRKNIPEAYGESKQVINCGICFEPIDSKEMKITECLHKFHNKCLNKWISEFDSKTKSPTCPSCRHILPRSQKSLSNHAYRQGYNCIRKAIVYERSKCYNSSIRCYKYAIDCFLNCMEIYDREDKHILQTNIINYIKHIQKITKYAHRDNKENKNITSSRPNSTSTSTSTSNSIPTSIPTLITSNTQQSSVQRQPPGGANISNESKLNRYITQELIVWNNAYKDHRYIPFYFKKCYHCKYYFKSRECIFAQLNHQTKLGIFVHKKCVQKKSGEYIRSKLFLFNKKGYDISGIYCTSNLPYGGVQSPFSHVGIISRILKRNGVCLYRRQQ